MHCEKRKMKKLNRQGIAILLCVLTFLLFHTFPVIASEKNVDATQNEIVFTDWSQLDTKSGNDFDEEEYASIEKYVDMMTSFEPNQNPTAKDYPEWYAGAYINEGKKLVVLLTEGYDSDATRSEAGKLMGGLDNVVFLLAKYSYRHLTETMDTINAYDEKNKDNLICFMWMIEEKENCVKVLVEKLDGEIVQQFKNEVSANDCIVLQQEKNNYKPAVALNPGAGVKMSGAGYGSMGFKVKLNGVVGFLTAAHVVNLGSNVYTTGGALLGNCTTRYLGSACDAAYVQITNTNYTPTGSLPENYTLTANMTNPPVGTTIHRVGATTPHTSGQITNVNVIMAGNNGYSINNCTLTNAAATGGDSGGAFYVKISQNTANPIGIAIGANNVQSIYCKATVATSVLGVTCY